jgi:hypothetical protein
MKTNVMIMFFIRNCILSQSSQLLVIFFGVNIYFQNQVDPSCFSQPESQAEENIGPNIPGKIIGSTFTRVTK